MTDAQLRKAVRITLVSLAHEYARDTGRMAVDVHMRFESDVDHEAVVGWLRKNTLHEVVEPEGGDAILRLDEAQDENAATIRANVLIKAAYPERARPAQAWRLGTVVLGRTRSEATLGSLAVLP